MKILYIAVQMLVIFGIMPDICAQGKIELMVIPTPQPFNFKSPTSLIYGALRTFTQRMISEKLYSRERNSLGHAFVRTKCFDGEENVDFWSGFNGHQKNAVKLAKAGAGLSVILYNYRDGYIQNTEYIHGYLRDLLKQKSIKPAFVRILVNQEQCILIKQHYEDFTNKDTLIYGFMTNPIDAGGAICTSYVVSYAQRAGIFSPFLEKHWKRRLRISTKLLGPTDQTDKIDSVLLESLSWFRLTNFFRPVKWSSDGDKVVIIDFFDPQLMVDFLRKCIKCLANNNEGQNAPELMNWLMENNARIVTNEYMQGIEINPGK